MTRAYMRLDPHVYDRKVLGIDHRGAPIEGWQPYPADALVAFFGVLALAEMQPERGRFRSERLLRELLRGADGRGVRYARQVVYLFERGDLVPLPGGQIYVDGWDEWQEGDVKPPARMVAIHRRRGLEPGASPGAIRQRRYRERHSDASLSPVTNSATVTRHAVEAEALAVSNSGGGVTAVTPSRRPTRGYRPANLPERLPGEAPNPRHEGQHPECFVCGTAKVPVEPEGPAAADPPEVSFDAPSPQQEVPSG